MLWSPDKELPAQSHWAVPPAGERVPRLAIRLALVMILLVAGSLAAAAWLGLDRPEQILLVGIIAALLACAAAFFLARSVLHPIERLTSALEMADGDGPAAIPVEADAETVQLSRALGRLFHRWQVKAEAAERELDEIRQSQGSGGAYEARERLFSAAVEFSSEPIVTTSLVGFITAWNPAAERLFGYTADEAIGRNLELIVPPERSPEIDDILQRARRGERVLRHDTVQQRKSGERIDVSLSAAPIKDSWGEIVGASIAVQDVTEAKLAQRTLRESEQLARGIVETALDGFVQIDQTGRILHWNSQAEKIFGLSRHDALGRNAFEMIVTAEDREALTGGLDRFLSSAESQLEGRRREVTARCADGSEIRVELSITALRRREGILVNVFFRDLTDRIAAEERIRHSEKMEAMGQLTGGVAHDFNNILTVITGTIEILADAVAKEPQLAAITKMIDEAAARGAELTQHLLAFARKQPLQPREIDLNTLIIDTAKLLRPTLGEQIQIESIFESESCVAVIDPNQLTTAILNLALNARDAMANGGKLVLETGSAYLDDAYARLYDIRPGPYVMIAVSDTGTGIPQQLLDRVFDPFFTSKGPGKGTGLGLSMVYGFVKQSSGHIKVYSEEGHGTTIKIYLPPGNAATAEVEAVTAEVERGTETILVVEDDKLVREYVLAQLHSLGYSTIAAANGTEALALVAAGTRFDLLFTDVIMPGNMNGRQLAVQLEQSRPGLKVVYTSGYTENAIIHHGRLDSGVLLLPKPYRKSDLARVVRKALDS